MVMQQHLDPLEVLEGFVDTKRLDELERVPGVDAAKQRHRYQLPPNELPIQ